MTARRKSEPELMGAAEAAEALGVRVSNLYTLAGLPTPYDRVRATALWRSKEIVAFAERRAEARSIPSRREAKEYVKLLAKKGPMTSAQVALHFDQNLRTVRRQLDRLAEDGTLVVERASVASMDVFELAGN